MRRVYSIALLLLVALGLSATTKEVKLKLLETSDIHGNFFPYNFIEQREWGGSLARVYSFVQEERRAYGDNLLLLDNGEYLARTTFGVLLQFHGYGLYAYSFRHDELYGVQCGKYG